MNITPTNVSRRRFLQIGAGSTAGIVSASILSRAAFQQQAPDGEDHSAHLMGDAGGHGTEMLMGTVDHERNGFDPMQMLVDWDYGTVTQNEDGSNLREYNVSGGDVEIEIAPGLFFPAWTYNG